MLGLHQSSAISPRDTAICIGPSEPCKGPPQNVFLKTSFSKCECHTSQGSFPAWNVQPQERSFWAMGLPPAICRLGVAGDHTGPTQRQDWPSSAGCPKGEPDERTMAAVPPAFAQVPHNSIFSYMPLAPSKLLTLCWSPGCMSASE